MGSSGSTAQSASSTSCSSDPTNVQQIATVTKDICTRWMKRDFIIKDVKLYTRPVQASYGGVDGPMGGLCHTYIIIDTGSDSYILERLQEGVRLANVTSTLTRVVRRSKLWITSTESISSKAVAEWTRKQSLRSYNFLQNNCIHFVQQFGQIFITQNPHFQSNFITFFQKANELAQKVIIDNIHAASS
eukprot:64183_1